VKLKGEVVMRALVLNGGRTGESDEQAIATVESILCHRLAEAGFEVHVATLREASVAYCRGCFQCWTRTPGLCRTHDAARDLTRRFILSDVVVFLTPVTFGGYSSELKKVLDRSIGVVSPFFKRIDGETHHRLRYARYPALLGVGLLPGPDIEDEALFRSLVHRNAMNLHSPAQTADVFYHDDDPDVMARRLDGLVESILVPA
jgi:multimeric flavodoxin WrbA